MRCDDLLRILNEYVDGTVDPSICEEFRSHLEGCNPCQVVVDNVRRTITLYRLDRPHELPQTFRVRLHGSLRERWQERQKG